MTANNLVLEDNFKGSIVKAMLQKVEIPNYLTENLKYVLFDWQREALQRFLMYENPEHNLVQA